jgi:hypothetical protein
MLITFAELAKLKNVSRAAVTKKKKTGLLDSAIVNHNGRELVNKEMAMDLWTKNSVPVPAVITAETKKELKKQVQEMPADAIPDFNISRAKKEFYTAELARIQVMQQKKELISAKVSNLFASETDASAIDSVMRQEIHSCLERFVKAA